MPLAVREVEQAGAGLWLCTENRVFRIAEGKQATTVFYCTGCLSQRRVQPASIDSWLDQVGITDRTGIRYQPTILIADSDGDCARAKKAAAQAA